MIKLYRLTYRKENSWKDLVGSRAFYESTIEAIKTMLNTGNETRYVAVRDPNVDEMHISPIFTGKPYKVKGISTRKGIKEAKKEFQKGSKYLYLDIHFHPDNENRDPLAIPSHSDLYVCDIQTRNFKGKKPVFGVGKYLENEDNSRIDILFYQRKKDTPHFSYLISRFCLALNIQRPFARKFRKYLKKEWKRRIEKGEKGNPYKDVVKGLEKTNLYNVAHLSISDEGMFTDKNLNVFS